MRIFIAVISILTSAGNIFLYCYVGSHTTTTFLRFSDIPYESLWYKFPVDLQKYLHLIIANAQRPRAFDGYAIMDLNLVTFVKVFFFFFSMNLFSTLHSSHLLIFEYCCISGNEKCHQFLFDDQNFCRIKSKCIERNV